MIFKSKYLSDNSFNCNMYYSKNKSRPSKSLVSCDLYTKFNKMKTPVEYNIFDTQDEIFKEIINYSRQEKQINVKFINENNLRKTLSKFLELKVHGNVIISVPNLYSYPNLEFIILICYLYNKCHVYSSKFSNDIYVCYFEYKGNEKVDELLENILKSWDEDLNLRLIGINIPTDIQNEVLNFNNSLFINKVKSNELLLKDMSLEKNDKLKNEKQLINNYYLKYLRIQNFTVCETCCVRESIFFNCKICVDCFCLYC